MRAAALVFSLYALAQAFFSQKHARYGYDQIFYLGCAQSQSLSADTLHARALREVRERFPAEQQDYFLRLPAYRAVIAESAAVYARQLPFYRGRLLYNGIVRLLWTAGVSPARAFVFLSVVPAAALAMLVFFWLARHFPPWGAAALAAAIVEAARLWPIARELTPDCLAQLLILSGCHAWIEKRDRPRAWGFFFAALLARPDSVLFTGPVGLWMAWESAPGPRAPARARVLSLLPLAALGGLHLLIQAFTSQYGWWTLFHHSFIGFLMDPERGPRFNPWQYRAILKRGLVDDPWETAPWFWACAAAGLIALRLRRPAPRGTKIFFLIALGGYVLHFFLFPIFWSRLLLGYHVALAVTAALLWRGSGEAKLRA